MASRFPKSTTSDFAEAVRSTMGQMTVGQLEAVAGDPSESDSDRFAALYAALQALNRQERDQDYAELVHRYEPRFGKNPYYDTFRALVAFGDGTSASGTREAIRYVQRAMSSLADRAGVQHQLASFYAHLVEINGTLSGEEIHNALDAVDRALSSTSIPNPNYHFTRARLLRAAGRVDDAIVEIGIAIHKQDATDGGGIRRLTRFEAFRSTLAFEKKTLELLENLEQTKANLQRARSEQVQLLGVLAAVIALITSSVTVAARWAPQQGLLVFLGIAGGITVSFATLIWSAGGARLERLIPAVAVGLGLVALAAWRIGLTS
jgi:tetratricopeptide (TPR) repeat protein